MEDAWLSMREIEDPTNWVLASYDQRQGIPIWVLARSCHLPPATSSYHLPTTYQADPNRVEVVGHGSGGLPQCLAAAAASEARLYLLLSTHYRLYLLLSTHYLLPPRRASTGVEPYPVDIVKDEQHSLLTRRASTGEG
eukprot:scaffold2807_cov60-Phaeocystis_antarctica.AAC.9